MATQSWGWPGFTAQVHCKKKAKAEVDAGDGRDSPLKYTGLTRHTRRLRAGDGRDSPLKYTLRNDLTA